MAGHSFHRLGYWQKLIVPFCFEPKTYEEIRNSLRPYGSIPNVQVALDSLVRKEILVLKDDKYCRGRNWDYVNQKYRLIQFVVQGGEYVNTDFKTLVDGSLETYGPFYDWTIAKQVWFENTCRKVDNCHHRLRILQTNNASLDAFNEFA